MKAVLHHYKLYHAAAPSKSTSTTSQIALAFSCDILPLLLVPICTERFWGFITAH
jgi:hypothetical protein